MRVPMQLGQQSNLTFLDEKKWQQDHGSKTGWKELERSPPNFKKANIFKHKN